MNAARLSLAGALLFGISVTLADTASVEGSASVRSESDEAAQRVVVLATREPQPQRELPVSVDRVERQEVTTGQLEVNLSETLQAIPGVIAQNRQNYAQDLQLSVRGFGARSSFGVRGVRLYSDGIPGTMPDGQGQFSHFELGSVDHIEVMRGPFSALYGNSSGGVIAVFTADGQPGAQFAANAASGSLATRRYSLTASGDNGSVNYRLDASHFETSGYRVHSDAERNLANAKVRFDLENGSRLTLVGNAIETPFIQDPLGLTRAQWQADPTQPGIGAQQYNTRKSFDQEQAGGTYERPLGTIGDLSATVYGGHRQNIQYQAIPAATEQRPTHPGGVIEFARGYGGADVHATEHLGSSAQLTLGLSYDRLDEARAGFLNFVGNILGVRGARRRDEENQVYDFDQYAQLQWIPTERCRISAGVRNGTVDVTSNNHLAALGTPALTEVRYRATNPVLGASLRAAQDVNLYASYGKGFETPTLNDLAYRSTDGSLPGLNLALRPARSDNFELGVKAGRPELLVDAAAFLTRTHDELAVAANAFGRTVYENIGATRRKGVELSLAGHPTPSSTVTLGYTYIDAATTSSYTTCVTLPCVPTLVPAGNRLPAVPDNTLYATLSWNVRSPSLIVTLEGLDRSKIYVDDRNSDAAPGYVSANFRVTARQSSAHWNLQESLRVDNLANHRYVGSVIVNETNSRFFEPDPGRTVYAIVTTEVR